MVDNLLVAMRIKPAWTLYLFPPVFNPDFLLQHGFIRFKLRFLLPIHLPHQQTREASPVVSDQDVSCLHNCGGGQAPSSPQDEEGVWKPHSACPVAE